MSALNPLANSSCMTIDEVIRLLETSQPRTLTPLQEKVLRLAWEGQTYSEMADVLHYQDAYLKNIASGLWQELSLVFGEPITKTNFALKLRSRQLSEQQQQNLEILLPNPIIPQASFPESPYGPVPLHSHLYIERPPIEQLAFTEIHKPGSVIRLKAPSKMGKSSLLLRIIAQAREANYHTIQIDFKEADQTIFESLDKLLRWLCAVITRQLALQPMLDDYWNEDNGSKVNCNFYLQNYLLPQLKHPLVISFNDLHHILAYPEIASDLLSLIRFWYEQAKQSELWQKLRLILVHSTEIYVPLRLHQSSFFNVGLPITIPEFTLEQVQELALRHGLDWHHELGLKKAQTLMTLIGGHPYMVRLAFYYICWRGTSLEKIIAEAATHNGIYKEHLQNYLVFLQSYPELLSSWIQVILASDKVQLEAITAYHLESLGLVKLIDEGVIPSCELYRQYFQKQLLNEKLVAQQVKRLEEDNQRLQNLCYVDEFTQMGNRRGFEQTLELEWRRMARNKTPLALILCAIDFYKPPHELDELQDPYLKQVAEIVKNSVQRASDYVANNGRGEFGIILPETDIPGATQIAERIRHSVESSKIVQASSSITVSLGVACIIPELDASVTLLLHETGKALYRSKKMGRNKVTVSSLLD